MIIAVADAPAGCEGEVGGKAASLIRMHRAGLPVPPAAVLDCAFFAPWFAQLGTLAAAQPDRIGGDDGELGRRALALALDDAQREALQRLPQLVGAPAGSRYAVRSSAADEDSADASFAGLYETLLGVPWQDLEHAVRRCFAAYFDPRVLAYRRQRGIEAGTPRFAVVVQLQIDSEVSGVGFSVNPLSNDHDEALIEAGWGLGTAVVDGRVAADRYLVDKPGRTLVAETRGDKQLSVRLAPAGGVVETREPRAAGRTLTDAQLDELTSLLGSVESLYGFPVDIEWAYAGGVLHVLQARPITTVVPLPDVMLTRPGEPRRLYMDAALSKGMTSNAAFSPLGLDQTERAFRGLIETWIGPVGALDTPASLVFCAGGRMYMNLSDLLRLTSPRALARGHAPTDTLTAGILAGIDAGRYRSRTRPRWLSLALLWRIPRALWRIRRMFWYLPKGLLAPEAVHRQYLRTSAAVLAALRARLEDDGRRHDQHPPARSLDELQRGMTACMAGSFDVLMAALLLGTIPPRLALGRRSTDAAPLLEALTRGVAGNVVVDMGLALHRLAGMLDRREFEDTATLAAKIGQRRLPAPFLEAWDAFMHDYGWRGPDEMDAASPRYADDPALALRQMSFMAVADGFDLQRSHARHAAERERAFSQLEGSLGPLRRWLLRRIRRLNELFAGARDTPKHVNVLCNYVIRRRALREGARLVAAGRLDAPAHVFDLGFADLDAAAGDPALDLRALRADRTRFLCRVRSQVRQFPPVIDSRGRILRAPPAQAAPGVLVGMAVAPGVARGPVKVLRSAGDKRVDPGDVLVAYTTDPGWTPLFVNAAAVVLEVGGVLQHGAVVAREFGKPCVVGLASVTEALLDGEWVEVDGAAGTVTRVDAPQ